MANITSAVLDALKTRLDELTIGLPIAAPNRNFTLPTDGRYLEVAFIPNGSVRTGVNSHMPQLFSGLLQINVWWNRNRGIDEPSAVVDAIVNHFPVDLKLYKEGLKIRIIAAADVAGLLIDEAGARIPVTISWETYARVGAI
jgi:hypothetical protein